MRNGLKKWMLWISVVALAAMLGIQLFAAPQGWLPTYPDLDPALWATLVGGVAMLFAFILCRLCKSPATTIDHRQLASVSTVSILCGAALILCTAFEVYAWFKTSRAEHAPLVSGIDGLLQIVMWVLGVFGGAFLVRLGFMWLTRYISYHGKHRLWALLPVLWAWVRLARYVMSYSSTVQVDKHLGEFAMLVFTLLFFFSFARYVGAVGKEGARSPMLLFYACSTFVFGLTNAIVRLVGQWNRALSDSLPNEAGAADMAIGLLAVAVAIAVAYTRRTETVFERVRAEHPEWLPAEDEAADVAEEESTLPVFSDGEEVSEPVLKGEPTENAEPTDKNEPNLEEILKEFYTDKHKTEE